MFNKFLNYGLCLLLFLLPWQTRWIVVIGQLNGGPWEYGTIGLYAIDVLLVVLLLVRLFLNKPTREASKQENIFLLSIVGLILLSLVSTSFAFDGRLALYGTIKIILAGGLGWLIINSQIEKIKLYWSLLLGILVQAGLGIWQFFAQLASANKWLGLAEHKPENLGASVVEAISPGGMAERWLRAYGGFDHPNIFGGIMVVGLLLAVWLLATKKKKIEEKTSFDLVEFILILIIAILVVAGFLSFSKAAWLALLIGLIIIVVSLGFKKTVLGLATIIITIGLLWSQFNYLALGRIRADSRLDLKSTTERVNYLGQAKKIISQHWLGGVGFGNYSLAIKQELVPKEQSYYYQPVHNLWLLLWSELGAIGLIMFLLLNLVWLKIVFKTETNNKWLFISLSACFLVFSLVDHWLISSHFGLLFLFLVYGLGIKKDDFN